MRDTKKRVRKEERARELPTRGWRATDRSIFTILYMSERSI